MALALGFAAGAAHADTLAAFNAALEDVAAHNRAAIGYLRSAESRELASAEMAQVNAAWAAFSEHFGKDRPTAFADNPLYTQTLVDVPVRVVGASLMVTMGRPDLAVNALQAVRRELSALRRASHVEVLADCVLDLNAAVAPAALWAANPPDLADAAAAARVSAQADAVVAVLARCESTAAPELRRDPAFRRLIDGAHDTAAAVAKAVAARDMAMLRRAADELRNFDDLLTLRYG